MNLNDYLTLLVSVVALIISSISLYTTCSPLTVTFNKTILKIFANIVFRDNERYFEVSTSDDIGDLWYFITVTIINPKPHAISISSIYINDCDGNHVTSHIDTGSTQPPSTSIYHYKVHEGQRYLNIPHIDGTVIPPGETKSLDIPFKAIDMTDTNPRKLTAYFQTSVKTIVPRRIVINGNTTYVNHRVYKKVYKLPN